MEKEIIAHFEFGQEIKYTTAILSLLYSDPDGIFYL